MCVIVEQEIVLALVLNKKKLKILKGRFASGMVQSTILRVPTLVLILS